MKRIAKNKASKTQAHNQNSSKKEQPGLISSLISQVKSTFTPDTKTESKQSSHKSKSPSLIGSVEKKISNKMGLKKSHAQAGHLGGIAPHRCRGAECKTKTETRQQEKSPAGKSNNTNNANLNKSVNAQKTGTTHDKNRSSGSSTSAQNIANSTKKETGDK